MNYSETIDYLYSRLPMFSNTGASAIKKDITNTVELCHRLNNPHLAFKSVHVAGTNGKGSTSHMLAAILQKAGLKTGLYTSPHLRDFRERIKINGVMISEEEVVSFVTQQQKNIEEIGPSFFEVTVAMAFSHFAKHDVEIAVVEVGLGGRLDSTNIITPLLSVITNISLDHTNILGNTLPEIAFEKAGIIKPGIPVVIGQRQDAVEDVFSAKAVETQSKIIFASDEWQIERSEPEGRQVEKAQKKNLLKLDVVIRQTPRHNTPDIPLSIQLDLTGSYQLKNLATVLSSIVELRLQGIEIPNKAVTEALSDVKGLTGLMGRWHVLSSQPLVICDTGHNEDGIREVVGNIEATPHDNLHIVLGMLKDKDITSVLQLLPKDAVYYFCQPALPRAKKAEDLAAEAYYAGLEGEVYPSVSSALDAAKKAAGENDLVFVGGSTFVVAEVV